MMIAALVFCTTDHEKVEKRTRSKWSSVLGYAMEYRSSSGALQVWNGGSGRLGGLGIKVLYSRTGWHIIPARIEMHRSREQPMARFFQPDLTVNFDSPFVRDGGDKLIRRSYWLDMDDRTLVMVMLNSIGANLTNEEKRAHLTDLRREHLIDQICIQEILPPER